MAVDQSRWRYIVTDTSGNPAGRGPVFNASQKQYSHHKNIGKTAQFTINIDNPVAGLVTNFDCLLKVYRQTKVSRAWQLMMIGDVIHAEESGQGDAGLVTIVAADPFWRLQRRLVGMGIDAIGRGTGYSDGTVSSQKDYTTLIKDIVVNLNTVFNTGIYTDGGTFQNSGTTGYIGPVYAQNAGDLIQQFCNAQGGPDIELAPFEPIFTMPSTLLCTLNVYTALGQSRPNAVFEYGTGQYNVATYDRILSKDGLCNQAFSPPPGFPSVSAHGDTMVSASDATSYNTVGLYQDIVQGDLMSTALRQELCNEYVTIRKQARQQITFTPTVDCNLDYNVDYTVGDTVTARAVVSGTYRYNGSARIYGVDIAVDDNDAETASLTLIPGG